MELTEAVKGKIEQFVHGHRVVLFMKGTRRITSYNVCYTKLLRRSHFHLDDFAAEYLQGFSH